MSTFTASPSKILLIDSNVFFAKRLSDALKQEGLEVVHSTQSAYALTMLEWNMPTAILCATNLRELGAHDIPRILNIDLKTAHIPVIAIGEGGDQADGVLHGGAQRVGLALITLRVTSGRS